MVQSVKIGNSQAFWGDRSSASLTLIEAFPKLDYLTLDYLAEVSLSIMAIQKEKNQNLGYARDFLDVIKSLIPTWTRGSNVKIITNAGGLNPFGCMEACQKLLKEANLDLKIGIVFGDDVISLIQNDLENRDYSNLDTNEKIEKIKDSLITANAYLGAKPIVDALSKGADIVITGRVADPSLTLGAIAYHFNWDFLDYDKLAGGTIAGHLIECGTQVTGGISTDWLLIEDKSHIGYPVVEVFEDGSFMITKPKNTGGMVNEETVKEQLLYEIGDPANILTPDVTVSILELDIKDLKNNQVYLKNAKGKAPPKKFKVSACYRDGYKAEAFLTIIGDQAYKKAKCVGKVIFDHVKELGYDLQKEEIEILGALERFTSIFKEQDRLKEVVLRIAAKDQRKEAIDAFTKEIAPLVTCGPLGVTGYLSGRAPIREVFGFWPCLIERSKVKEKTEVF